MLLIFMFIMSLVGVGIVSSKDLLNSVVLQGAFSLFSVLIYSILRAPDVGVTEVAVGAAVSTIFSLLVIAKIGRKVDHWSIFYGEASGAKDPWWVVKFLSAMCFFVLMVTIAVNFHDFGSAVSVISRGSDAAYLSRTIKEFDIEEIVTAVLGGYRGFDTMIETTVGFSAAFGMREILKKRDLTFRRKL
jgi:multicomponent Na+:H+ antiporter subunit B